MTTPATAQEYEGQLPMTKQQVSDFSLHGRSIPKHMIAPVLTYFNNHIPPGSFLEAVLSNKFVEAVRRADEKNLVALDVWAAFLYWEAPAHTHGSPEKVEAWLIQRMHL